MPDATRHAIADLGRLLDGPAPEPLTPVPLDASTTPWTVLRLAPGERWDASAVADERTLLVLEGIATVHVEDWRYSSGSGHLIAAAPGASLAVINDGATPFAALLAGHPPVVSAADGSAS